MISPKDESPIGSNRPLCLASASLPRVALLRQIGFVPTHIYPSHIDETPIHNETPKEYVTRMATIKGKTILTSKTAALPMDAVVLAADTMVARGRQILPKPENRDSAAKCLKLISGHGIRIYTALWAMGKSDTHPATRLVITRLKIKRLSASECIFYLDSQQWCDKACGLALQGYAAAFIQTIIGSPSNIIGLSLFETAAMLDGMGVRQQQSCLAQGPVSQ